MSFRKEKLDARLKDLVSSFIQSKLEQGVFVTVTKIEMTTDFKEAFISITVFPEAKELDVVKRFKRTGKELSGFIFEHIKTRSLPHIEIELDKGEIAKRRFEEVLKKAT